MTYEVYLAHHGIKGQKWGVRRYQNSDGTYTEAGKKRYMDDVNSAINVSEKSSTAEAKASRKLSKSLGKVGISPVRAIRKARYNKERKKSSKDQEAARDLLKKGLSDMNNMNLSHDRVKKLFDQGKKFLDDEDFNDIVDSLNWKDMSSSGSYLNDLIDTHFKELDEDRRRHGGK